MLRLRKLFLGLVVLVTFALGSLQAAHADQFNLKFVSSGGYDVMGTIFATSNGDGSYTAKSGSLFIPLSATGFVSGNYSLLPINGFADNDNLVFPTTNPVVDATGGLSFGTAGGYAVNLAASDPYFLFDTIGNGISGDLTLTPAAVPELSTMLGFGSFVTLGGIALLRQRKHARKAA